MQTTTSSLESGANAQEGMTTKKIENITAKVPSLAYLGLAFGSMALAISLQAFTNRKSLANFVGLWVPSFLLIGIYNKLVKLEGNDQFSRQGLH